jgi:hypothetical protein
MGGRTPTRSPQRGTPNRVSARPEKGCAGGVLSRDRPPVARRHGVAACCAVWGSRRSPSGVALARGARPPARSRRRAERGKPCAGCYRQRDGERRDLAAIGGRSPILTGRGVASGDLLLPWPGLFAAAGLRYVVNKECYAQLRAGNLARKPYISRVSELWVWTIPRSFVGDTTN